MSVRQDLFLDDIHTGVTGLISVTELFLRKIEKNVRRLPSDCFLLAYDAIHLMTAAETGFTEIWSNDRHLLTAARHFGLVGRSV